MKLAMFSAEPYDRRFFDEAVAQLAPPLALELAYYTDPLALPTVALAHGCEAVCVFV